MPTSQTLRHTPVALLVFNRPQPTARVFEAVARARPATLLVVADGPRSDRPDDRELCRQTRAVIERADWQCEVLKHYSDTNLGCRKRISSGLDWVFSNVSDAIILEDDCLPEPSFFPFCEELLERYRDDERVAIIRGGNFLEGRRVASTSYYFSRWYHIWGWATWARAWKHNDVSMSGWPELRDGGWLDAYLPHEGMRQRARQIFDDAHAGRIDTWEYEWVFSSWKRDALAICPLNNMVTNIGFAPGAAHLGDPGHPHAEIETRPTGFPLRHPTEVKVSEKADLIEWELLNPSMARRTLLERAYGRLRKSVRAHRAAVLGRPVKRLLVTHRRKPFVRKLDRYLVRLHEAIENRNYDARVNGEQRVLEGLGQHHDVRTILDVGANTGSWTVYASTRFPEARVFSLEIVESTYRTLVANCAGRANVSLHHLGLSDQSGEIEIFFHEGASQLATSVRGSIESFHGVCTRSDQGSVTTGDEFCESQGINAVDFLKIDVEGMENRVIKGFARMLREERIGLIQFEYGYVNVMTKFLLKDFYDTLTRYGMVIGKIYPTYVDFRDYQLTHEDFLGPNYLAVHSSLPGVIQALGE